MKTGEKYLVHIFKPIFLYAAFATAFSIIGLFPILDYLPTPYMIGSPLEVSGISVEHIAGHIVFGLIAGIATLSMRYFVLAGLFPIALDADHLIQFLNLEAVPRMAHSLAFGIIAAPLMMLALGKRDYRLGAVSLAAVFAHASFDIVIGGKTKFPFYIPLENKMIQFEGLDWIPFLITAVAITAMATIITKRQPNVK